MTMRRSHRGFTLVEVLATLVLVGIVLPAVMKGISLSLSAASMARRSEEATALAESKLNEIVVGGLWSSGSMSGDFGQDWPDYRWTAYSENWMTDLMLIQVQVTWTAGVSERSVQLTTAVYTGEYTTMTAASSSTGTGSSGGSSRSSGSGGGSTGQRLR